MKKFILFLLLIAFCGKTSLGQKTTEVTNENETSIKNYLDSSKLEPIEGIYKAVGGTYYRIGIKKINDKFLAIILDAEDKKNWKVGDVKAYLENSSLDNIFSIKWLMGDEDKTPKETIGKFENEALLKIILPTGLYGSNEESIFLKMYPVKKSDSKSSINSKIVTGSGFFVSTNGLIATNAHVVNNAKEIELIISNDIGNFTYKAKLLLIDNRNDVAIIKIDDESFKELTLLPYGLSEQADVGEKSFTIGYPLNDIMGTNYKVTDGIISAKSGIGDDVRYYQISIPLQPGNSGGPLFNNDGNIIGITTAKLNSDAVGISIENVNYAIKVTYLISLMNMLPNTVIPMTTTQLVSKDLKEQVKILKNYVCLIQVTE
jgi:S1-C subfamily serine protease